MICQISSRMSYRIGCAGLADVFSRFLLLLLYKLALLRLVAVQKKTPRRKCYFFIFVWNFHISPLDLRWPLAVEVHRPGGAVHGGQGEDADARGLAQARNLNKDGCSSHFAQKYFSPPKYVEVKVVGCLRQLQSPLKIFSRYVLMCGKSSV